MYSNVGKQSPLKSAAGKENMKTKASGDQRTLLLSRAKVYMYIRHVQNPHLGILCSKVPLEVHYRLDCKPIKWERGKV